MTDSTHVQDLVDDYVHGLLDAPGRERVEHHCNTCESCNASLEQARRRKAAIQEVPPTEAAPELVEITLDMIEQYRLRKRRFRRRFVGGALAALAAGVLVLIGVQAYYHRLKPTPYELSLFGQRELFASSSNSLRLRLVHTERQEPLANVPVTVDLISLPDGQTVELASFTTDHHGSGEPRFDVPDWSEGEYELRVTAKTPGKDEVLTRRISLKRSWQIMLSSDKPVYQPGQTIHIRALALRKPNLRPLAGEEAVFTLADPKGNILFKQKSTTSKFGITAADCELAHEILEGPYTLACKIADTESKLTVEVQKYVLPKFKVEAKLDRAFYAPGEEVKLTIQSDYFFGKPVAKAKVKAHVLARDFALHTLNKFDDLVTDDKGSVAVLFKLPDRLEGRPQDGGDSRIVVDVEVTDSADQQQAVSVERLVTTRPVRIEAIPESKTLVRGVPNRIYFIVTRVDGTAVKCQVAVSSTEGERRVETNSLGVGVMEITPAENREARNIKAVDADGKVLARTHVEWFCGELQRDFLVRTDKAVYRAGESMKLTVLGGGVEPIFVDFVRESKTQTNRQLVLSTTIDVKDGQGEHTLDLPADLYGTLRIYAYRFRGDGLAHHKTRLVYVHPPSSLTIKAVLDKGEYTPGSSSKIRFRITDADGKPAPGALSLAAVDTAVFEVLAQKPGIERTFFTLEKELLKPVYAIYDWKPDFGDTPLEVQEVDRGTPAEREARDRALFAATASDRTFTLSEDPGRAPDVSRGDRPGGSPSSPHTLTAASFMEKVRSVNNIQKTARKWIFRGYVLLALLAGLCAYAVFWMVFPLAEVLKIHAVVLIIAVPFGLLVTSFLMFQRAPRGASEQAAFAKGSDTGTTGWGTTGGKRFMDGMPKTGMAKSLEGGPPPLPAPTAIPETVAGKLEEASPPPRVREHFPETLLWKPQLITNDQGEATLDLELADSITTWRLSASAVNSEGHLGSAQLPIKVFQPFFVDLNLPVSLTRNDEVGVPVVVYNYLDGPQTVTLTLKEADWFELDGELKREVTLAAGEVKAFRYRIKVKKVGQQQLEVVAIGMGEARDALRREIAVEPDGRRVETVNSGSLSTPVEMPLVVPDDAIDGSVKAFVKIYPSTFSQLVEGLDNIFRMPSGCFEQTSSTTYPNILALDYLKRTNQSVPEVEAKARQYIHLGYQRLVGFEVDGGGFDWFGRPPANRSLTAYGLMEFEDMARVHDVDPDLIRRTRNWLLRQRDADGSWAPDGGLHEGGARGQDEKMQRLSTTAYIAWAVFSSPDAHRAATATKDFLLNHSASEIHDPYILALMANALLAMDERGADAAPYLERLEQLKKTAADGKHVYWEQPEGSRTTFHGRGRSGSIETTALACLALIEAKAHPASSRAGLTWLITQKDPHGTWHSTQATVLSLKALVAATGSSLGGEKQRRILLRLGEQFEKEIAIAPDQAEVLQLIDLSPHLQPGRQQISLEETTDTGSGYQITFRYHVPGEEMARDGEPLKITMDFDRTDLKVNDVLKISATVVNQTAQPAPMVMLDLPIPAGFVVQADDFQKLVDMKEIARYQVRARQVIVYLRNLQPNRPLNLTYSLQATMPVKIATPGARAYEYYAPDRQGRAPGKNLTVKE